MHLLQALIAGLFVCLGVTSASGQEPFFKEKRLSLLVNFAPGGGVDVAARLLARHLAKHIEGKPSIIVQNIDGAGGLNGANYLGEVAPRDGTVLGYLGGVAWPYVMTPDRFRVNMAHFEYVAYESVTTIFVARRDVGSGINEATDIAKAKGLVSGGLAVTHSRDLTIRLTLDMLGVPYRHVTGYSSSEKARLALQRNEISFAGETTPAYRSSVVHLVKGGVVIPVYFSPDWNGESLSIPKQVADLDILPFHELYRKIKGGMPSGSLWDAYLAVLALNSTMTRFLAFPPGAPPAAKAALQNAIRLLNSDSAFAEDTRKVLGYVPDNAIGTDTNRIVRQALVLRPEIKEFLVGYLKKPKN